MRVEVLFFEGCPNHAETVQRLKEVLKEVGVGAQIAEIAVPDAETARVVGFLGSPTIRIDGFDVEPAARASREFGMMCRTYLAGGKRQAIPSREMIRAALREEASAN
ncbi:MAG: DUF2703 domain-containing protein [Acidobacteria bacterium]|nr:DUF2703 domain-containing protein [Acidobacteriota bacterium]MCI0724850.1 DUF2703 domain-containing protein [Acidobacteriota bacterium]